MIKTNAELAEAVNRIIIDAGIKKTWIANKLGMKRQAIDNLLSKKNFSIDDANRILALMNKEISVEIIEKNQ